MNRVIVTALLFSTLTACGGVGQLSLTAWGEDFIEQELPATNFEDGFSVKYTKFLVVLKDFTLATKTGKQGPSQSGALVVDLTKPGPIELQAFTELEAIKWDEVSYGLGPAASATGVGAVSAADVETMKSTGSALWVEGTLSKGGTTKSFSWKFATDTHFSSCTSPDYGEGVTVPTGGTVTVELTIHGDHLWYDDLQSPDAKLRGTAIAGADANADGVITQQELAAVQLTSLPLGQYGTGGASNVKTLDDFVRELGRTVGHFRGEGECVARAK
jgi:hypothetical protein